MNTKLHAIADANGRPMRFFMTAGQVKRLHRCGRAAGRPAKARWLLGNCGYDADWFGEVHQDRRSRVEPVRHDKRCCRRRSEIMFGRLQDWRRVATRYDRRPTALFSAVALAATVIS